MSGYELLYFPIRGRAQAIRYLLVDNDIPYKEENAGPFETWLEKHKPLMPFGQVPLLTDGDFQVPQFNTILRYLGRKHNLQPTDVKEAAKVDMITDHVEDVRGAYVKMIYGAYESGKDDFVKGLGAKLQPFENLLSKWKTDFITQNISFADYNLFDLLEILQILAPDCLEKFPTLKSFVARMSTREKIKAFQSIQSNKDMPVNGNGKQ